MNIKSQIQELISLGKTEEALELLEQLTSDAVLLQSRFNGAKRQHSMGMIDFSEWSRTLAQINYSAMEMMNSAKLKTEINVKVETTIQITVNMTATSFEEAINSLPLTEVKNQCLKAFQHFPAMLDEVLDTLAPIERAEATNRTIPLDAVPKAKAKLVELFTSYVVAGAKAKSAEQKSDLQAIADILKDEVDEATLLGCFDALEIFFASNTGYTGLEELQRRREKYLNGPIEKILRKSEGRIQARTNEERTWIVQVTNRIIKHISEK